MYHLSLRTPWHDSGWNGTVCAHPTANASCLFLDRIRSERDDALEIEQAGKNFGEIETDKLPPCAKESGSFMNLKPWVRRFIHPYSGISKAQGTHGHLAPTDFLVPPHTAFAVPFNWMLRSSQETLDASLPEPLPRDETPPFATSWVFGRERQNCILELFFGRLTPEKSLVFFYCKEGTPVGEELPRVIVGVGRINRIHDPIAYQTTDNRPTYLAWDRPIAHSVRVEGSDGFLLPYHSYLESTGDLTEDERRLGLLRQIVVPGEEGHMKEFSYAAELLSSDLALSVLVRLLASVRKIREHGIAQGPWLEREEWLNARIAECWKERGAFPGIGSVLEAVGVKMGTSLCLDLVNNGSLKTDVDPWYLIDGIMRGTIPPPSRYYTPQIEAARNTWINLDPQTDLSLLKLLSRFAITPEQARRWYDPVKRNRSTSVPLSTVEILENPYRICETDLGSRTDPPIPLGVVDRGLLPEDTIRVRFPVPEPSDVKSTQDWRRLRAALVTVLRDAAGNGDTLLSTSEAVSAVLNIGGGQAFEIGSNWPRTNENILKDVISRLELVPDPKSGKSIEGLQLTDVKAREERLGKIMNARLLSSQPSLGADWATLIKESLADAQGKVDLTNPKHQEALKEQVDALEKVTTRKLTVLTGKAGTGKTTVLGALFKSPLSSKGGILLLAPTGKARVKLKKATGKEALTVAQFLYQMDRYDAEHQLPRFSSGETYKKEKTIVVDECSMMTLDDFSALFGAIDLAHVTRIILVGDPSQLPPIGAGRPFADLVAYMEDESNQPCTGASLQGAIARLNVEVRTAGTEEEPSDTLRLASLFMNGSGPVDSDRSLSEIEFGKDFNDLEIRYWKDPEELHDQILASFKQNLGIQGPEDTKGFDQSLGFDENGYFDFMNPDKAESWQILSPVRKHAYGVHDLNRWIQMKYRKAELDHAEKPWGKKLGDESIVRKDKVIQLVNKSRKGFKPRTGEENFYLANGEVGIVAIQKNDFFNVLFAGRPGYTFGFSGKDFLGGTGPLELAYALTVHKAQGSEFQTVFVVIPKTCRLLSRELLYTALTRSRNRMVLLLEGNDPTILYEYSRPERSETGRRNTNLFIPALREHEESVPFAQNLIHRTADGKLVRSKSEMVIANLLYGNDPPIQYEYERPLRGEIREGILRPDFSFTTAAGDIIIWEHLGMMDKPDYRAGWEWKREWYRENGFIEGENLFTSTEGVDGAGLDSAPLAVIVEKIASLI